jgi:hypothetical protein
MLDFTLGMYRKLCETCLAADFEVVPLNKYSNPSGKKRLYLRHDVDRQAKAALEMAKLEKLLGISSTYFFRMPANPSVMFIGQIAALGMEIGYHYECLDQANGDMAKALDIFKTNLEKMRKLCPVTSISMHGNPLSKNDNRDLWKEHNFHQFGLDLEAYLTIDYNKVAYFSDTGRNWDPRKHKVYDVTAVIPDFNLKSTMDIMTFLGNHRGDICLLTHPNRWTDNIALWLYNYAYDMAGNAAKYIVRGK